MASARRSLPDHAPWPVTHLADRAGRHSVVGQLPDDALRVIWTGDNHEADSHVEHAVHLRFIDRSVLLDPAKHLRHGPRSLAKHDLPALRQNPLDILHQTAARDMRQAAYDVFDAIVLQDVLDGPHVDSGRLQEHVRRCAAQLAYFFADLQPGGLEEHLPGQTVAVGVQPGGRQAQHRVAAANRPAVDDPLSLDDADAKPGHVVFAALVEARQDGRLAADQRAIGLQAALADAADQLLDELGVLLRKREV